MKKLLHLTLTFFCAKWSLCLGNQNRAACWNGVRIADFWRCCEAAAGTARVAGPCIIAHSSPQEGLPAAPSFARRTHTWLIWQLKRNFLVCGKEVRGLKIYSPRASSSSTEMSWGLLESQKSESSSREQPYFIQRRTKKSCSLFSQIANCKTSSNVP